MSCFKCVYHLNALPKVVLSIVRVHLPTWFSTWEWISTKHEHLSSGDKQPCCLFQCIPYSSISTQQIFLSPFWNMVWLKQLCSHVSLNICSNFSHSQSPSIRNSLYILWKLYYIFIKLLVLVVVVLLLNHKQTKQQPPWNRKKHQLSSHQENFTPNKRINFRPVVESNTVKVWKDRTWEGYRWCSGLSAKVNIIHYENLSWVIMKFVF